MGSCLGECRAPERTPNLPFFKGRKKAHLLRGTLFLTQQCYFN
jgi:hypothetical protein